MTRVEKVANLPCLEHINSMTLSHHRPVLACLLRLCLAMAMVAALPVSAADDTLGEGEPIDLFDEDAETAVGGWPRLWFAVGYTYLDGDGTYKLRSPGGESITLVDFERAGIKDTDSSLWLSAGWRSRNGRWGAWFSNWKFDNIGTRQWDDTVSIGPIMDIPVGASVTTSFAADWYVVEVTYSLFRNERVDAGLGVGIHAVNLDTTLEARIEAGDLEAEIIRAEFDTLAPLPNVTGYVNWRIDSNWSVTARAGWFGLDYSKYSGEMINAYATINRQLGERWGLSLGYQLMSIEADVDEDRYQERYDMDFSGPLLILRFAF